MQHGAGNVNESGYSSRLASELTDQTLCLHKGA